MDKKLKALVKERDGFARKCAGQEKALLEMADEVCTPLLSL